MAHRCSVVVLLHLTLAAVSSYMAMWLRFDGLIPVENWEPWLSALPWLLAIRAVSFGCFGLYHGLWRYAGIWDLRNIVLATLFGSSAFAILIYGLLDLGGYPRSVLVIDAVLLILMLGGVRLTKRLIGELDSASGVSTVLVYGAGDAGEMIVRDMKSKGGHRYRPIGFVDDDGSKVGLRIHGVPVLGTSDDLKRIMRERQPSEVLVAIPRAEGTTYRSVLRALDQYDVPVKTLPNLHELLDCKVNVQHIRDLSLQDLLSRGPVGLDSTPTRRLLRGRRVLVTGAGGSIGSELCRQIASVHPSALVLVDHAENGLFHLTNVLADHGHRAGIHALVGDVTDRSRMSTLFDEYRPEIVFHAAAHKHVPLMEANVCEAVTNNVAGTRVMAETAERYGVDRFVLISTDKAVNPTSVMGVTKRVGELLLQTQGAGSGTTFVTVRFGNVLGSSGSVIPRFVQQIEAGGPVTVTHPDVRRFFMLVSEAVQLVLHTAALGEPGKLYVLKMGEQVKLVDLAHDLIRLAGYVPERDIPITFTGLRPGEKLFEEFVGQDESASTFRSDRIMKVAPHALSAADVMLHQIEELEQRARQNNTAAVYAHLGAIVPAFSRNRAVRPLAPQTVVENQPARERPVPATVPAGAVTGQVCPACASVTVYQSHVRSRLERIRRAVSPTTIRPYRCHTCGWRGWLTPVEFFPSMVCDRTLSDDPDLASIDAAVGVVAEDHRPAFAPRNLEAP